MTNKYFITGLTAVFFTLVLVGVSSAQEYEGAGPEFGFSVERNIKAIPSTPRLDPNANWEALAALPYEASLESTYDFQVNKDKYVFMNDGQMTAGTASPNAKSSQPCVNVNNGQPGNC